MKINHMYFSSRWVPLVIVLLQARLLHTHAEYRRLINQGAIKVDGDTIRDDRCELKTHIAGNLLDIDVGNRGKVTVALWRG